LNLLSPFIIITISRQKEKKKRQERVNLMKNGSTDTVNLRIGSILSDDLNRGGGHYIIIQYV